MGNSFLFTAMVFYITLTTLFVAFSVDVGEAEDLLVFPVWPDIPTESSVIASVPILGALAGFLTLFVEFFQFMFLVIQYFFTLAGVVFVQTLPYPINVILFLPIAVFAGYEILARLIRGS